MINRVKVLIVVNIENRPVFIDSGIIFYLDSTKIKEWLKLYLEHCFVTRSRFTGISALSRKAGSVHLYSAFLPATREKDRDLR